MVLFPDELAVVTGAGSNIGMAIALKLAQEGADLVLVDIDEGRLRRVASDVESFGRSAQTITVDLASQSGWRAVADLEASASAMMFIHAACPARNEADTVPHVSEDAFDAMMNVNVRSGFFIGRTIGLAMQRRQVSGRMLFVTSLHAATPRNLPHYAASKAGMTMIMVELARFFANSGIRVNALAPGAVPGGGFMPNSGFEPLRNRIPMARAGTADEMAASAIALLSNQYAGYVTGTTLLVDGGLQHFNWIDMAGADTAYSAPDPEQSA